MDHSREEEIYKKIDAYITGSLSEEDVEALWVEFAKNPGLIDRLEIEVGVKEMLKTKNIERKKASVKSLPNWVWHASAAAVVLLVALVQLFRVETLTEMSDFLVQNIPNDQIETANGIRSNEPVISSADSLLNIGFAAISEGNDTRASEIFAVIISDYNEEPYASKAFLNAGIVHYNNGNYEASILEFNEAAARAKENRMISEKAYWYLGNAYAQVGDLKKAIYAIGEAYNRDGVFKKDAYILYQKLNYDMGNIDLEGAEGTPSDQ
jgi:tetratricopeptide (TPR) repeat protein